jgi:glycine amidinotransferase
LASTNISVNVLSLDEENVLVFSPDGEPPLSLVRNLEKHGFSAHTLRFRHSKVFDGGLHCATLDTVREDACENYLS